ncbi:hypothetical protein DMH04_30695 [Kibdelosporangium aridum]|uniref:Uncharacterized protein n=1 Tax=Kibdelosporangium aridum TaxID=2030 RepID=A0A428Z2M5_KIBAR|nr:hypothetical protein [Kibdelosporangium aridum]RSM79973.1 hypothetical protein DMH04_30695 [Kibdelosporangium aridum]
MSLDDKRWYLLAQELQFQQLDGARKLAESWRTGLAALTSLFAAVMIVKGPDSIGAISEGHRVIVAVAIGVAFLVLVTATMLAVRAASGAPGDEILLTGEDLRTWTRAEVKRVRLLLRWAIATMLVGVLLVAVSAALTWFAPVKKPAATVEVLTGTQRLCGELVPGSPQVLTIKVGGASVEVPVRDVVSLVPHQCKAG